jgi:hypothetical protein
MLHRDVSRSWTECLAEAGSTVEQSLLKKYTEAGQIGEQRLDESRLLSPLAEAAQIGEQRPVR